MMETTAYTYDDKSVIFPSEAIAVVSDIHFSHETPQKKFKSIQNRLLNIVQKYDVEQLVFNGDTFNEFPFVEDGVHVLNELDNHVEVTLIEGNHEQSVGGFTTLQDRFTVVDEVVVTTDGNKFVVLHGHTEPTEVDAVDAYIIGHLHPTIDSGRPCAVRMKDQYNGTDVIVMPAFAIHEGQDITVATDSSPLLVNTPEFVVEERF